MAPQELSQPILPGWMFAGSVNLTEENSSSPETERAIVSQYSYGRQLGRIIDVLSELIERWPGGSPDGPAVERFTELRDDVRKIKTHGIRRATSALAELEESDPAEFARLAPELRAVLGPDTDSSRSALALCAS